MTTFSATTCKTALDPLKHVKYTKGMVLGVEDFDQDFIYSHAHWRWVNADVLGFGTVSGLKVTMESGTGGPRVRVSKGVALNEKGEMICVPEDQCAYLNKWLAIPENKSAVESNVIFAGSPPGESVKLHVVLCFEACETDRVPIPGEPCRSEETAFAPSRIADRFRLELRLEPPAHTEEAALRDFVQWLAQVITTTSSPSSVTQEEFLESIEQALAPASPPLSPPDFFLGSPPAGMEINLHDLGRYLRAAFRLWVTTLRPPWHAAGCLRSGSCCGGEGAVSLRADDCLLLATLDVPLTVDREVSDVGSVSIDEEQRPFLLHLRFLQEWVLYSLGRAGGSGEPIIPAAMVPPPMMGPSMLSGPAAAPAGRVIAAGRFDRGGAATAVTFGNLAVKQLAPQNIYLLTSPNIQPGKLHTLRAATMTTPDSTVTHVVETVAVDELTGTGLSRAEMKRTLALRVRRGDGKPPTSAYQGFTVEITEYGT
jgi:hypothetical protein